MTTAPTRPPAELSWHPRQPAVSFAAPSSNVMNSTLCESHAGELVTVLTNAGSQASIAATPMAAGRAILALRVHLPRLARPVEQRGDGRHRSGEDARPVRLTQAVRLALCRRLDGAEGGLVVVEAGVAGGEEVRDVGVGAPQGV